MFWSSQLEDAAKPPTLHGTPLENQTKPNQNYLVHDVIRAKAETP